MTDPDLTLESVERQINSLNEIADYAESDTSKAIWDYPEAFRDCAATLRALSAALEAEQGWRTVAESNGQMAQSWQERAHAAEAALADARGEIDVEYLAFRLWRHEAERAAPNVAKQRTLQTFADQSPETVQIWMGFASAAIRALKKGQTDDDN